MQHNRGKTALCASPIAAALIFAGATTGVASSLTRTPADLLPEGTALSLVLVTPLSSIENRAGDLVVATLAEDVSGPAGRLPAGTRVTGRVGVAERADGRPGRARLSFSFDTLIVAGATQAIRTTSIEIRTADTSWWQAGRLALLSSEWRASAAHAGAGGSGVLATPRYELAAASGTRHTVTLLGPARA